MKSIDSIPKEVLREARNVVFSFPNDSYEEKLRKLDQRVYGSANIPQVVNPRHVSMALDEALKTF